MKYYKNDQIFHMYFFIFEYQMFDAKKMLLYL